MLWLWLSSTDLSFAVVPSHFVVVDPGCESIEIFKPWPPIPQKNATTVTPGEEMSQVTG
jgi:hypothetical protein